MTDRQNRYQNRNRATVNYMNQPAVSPKWTGIASIAAKVTALGNSVTAVDQIVIIQEMDIKGYRQMKELNKLLMAKKGAEVAGPLAQFALDINDLVLYNEINFSFSDLMPGKDSTATERNQLVYDRANTNVAALTAGGYGVDAAVLLAYQGLITAYNSTVGTPKDAKVVKVAATQALKDEVNNGNNIITALRRLMVPFKTSDVDFYNAFYAATKIDDVGVHHEYAVIRLLDSVTHQPIPAGTVTVVEQSITVKVSQRGYGRIKNAATGTVTLLVESPLYTSQTISNFVMTGLKPARLNVDMVKT